MSQEDRRRLRGAPLLEPPPHDEEDLPAPLRFRRYSEGLERTGLHTPHLGRFSAGAERLPEDDPSKRHGVGRFGDRGGITRAAHRDRPPRRPLQPGG